MSAPAALPAAAVPRERVRLSVAGLVQGVGFRPFVYRTAHACGVSGWVANRPAGVTVEAEGEAHAVDRFIAALRAAPAPISVASLVSRRLAPTGRQGFEIRPSDTAGDPAAGLLPDLATCEECLREIRDPGDRRHRYPFTNCTRCGPRYAIVEALPWDRAQTTMRGFAMCAACRAEYHDPAGRRFHAEANACPDCGPQLALWDGSGAILATRQDAFAATAEALRAGLIVAMKGLGGFHLLADARSESAVSLLRARKHRPDKPFAVMFATLAAALAATAATAAESALVASPERPIVIVAKRPGALAAAVAPGNPTVGVMLPYTPLHHLLLADLGFPLVATSGNRSDEPIVAGEREAIVRLAGIADLFLVHDRPIARPIDDSLMRVVAGRPMMLRRARGFAPAIAVRRPMPPGILAYGGHLKNTLALTLADGVVLSQHLGDLETPEARHAGALAAADLVALNATPPRLAARDLHPGYHSSRAAEASGLPVVAVQHHLAHVAAAIAEHDLRPPVLGVAWDGTGDGGDGTIWGGEFLAIDDAGWRRAATLRPFRLPGGEAAIREPRRAAFGLLVEAFGEDALAMTDLPPVAAFSSRQRQTLAAMIGRGVNAPVTTSAGRLFDAVAAILGLRQQATYEGQAAAELEWAAGAALAGNPPLPASRQTYGLTLSAGNAPVVLDWRPTLRAILADRAAGSRPRPSPPSSTWRWPMPSLPSPGGAASWRLY